MIWYLLYPFRGTTDPPLLGPAHPLRRAFTRYGREAARHPVITLLISVAIATILIYPFPFLYTNNFANGSSNLPHHVWTAAQPFDGNQEMYPDVVMRSFWVHGSHMKALERHVLQAALDIQDELLGPTINFNPRSEQREIQFDEVGGRLTPEERDSLHAVNGLGNSSWFFHSPLLYWNCSSQIIEADDDIIASVNERSRQPTSVNITLRHSIVFSGKRFEDQKLIAADALVITLIHKLDSPVALRWEREAESVTRRFPGRWRLYPPDGRTLPSQLYEFRFKPLSLQDDIILTVAYSLTMIYFLLSLTKLRALKSRFGLSVTVITQTAFSIMSSFTICAVFKIDLSKIPREAYPLVVLTVGLENVFRFINAIIVTPSQSPTAVRIGDALGQTGHVALAGVAQNLYILWLLGKVVSPGVTSFCIFAAIALTFDFLYLMTFFVAVLSVEVRRTELGDSLSPGNQRSRSRSRAREQKKTWIDAILRGDVPISTRISGTIVLIGFVLIAQWHFFDHENPMQPFSRLLKLTWMDSKPPSPLPTQLSVDVNQARSPTAWLRLQDHETAREVIQVIKPHSHSYIARVYDPLIFVLDGSDRRPSHQGVRSFLPAFYDFAKHQSSKLIVTIFFVVAAVSLLMNYLLWGEEDALVGEEGKHVEDQPLMAVKLLARAHVLDIGMLVASPDGTIVSVGLDRRVMVWNIRQDNCVHQVDTLGGDFDAFPILALAVDEHASWLALLCTRGIMLWNIRAQKWGPSVELSLQGRSPISFFFTSSKPDFIASIIIVRSNGMMTQVLITVDGLADLVDVEISKGNLVSAHQSYEISLAMQPQILTSSRNGFAYVTTQLAGKWVSAQAGPFLVDLKNPDFYVYPIPQLRAFLAIRQGAVDLIDVETLTSVHTFEGTLGSSPTSFRVLYSTQQAHQSIFKGLTFFSLVYTECSTGSCIIRTYTPTRDSEVFCIDYKKCPRDQPYSSWDNAIITSHQMEDPGKWETLPIGVVVGVRKIESHIAMSKGFNYSGFSVPTSSLRRRMAPSTPLNNEEDDIWEAWMLSARGEKHVIALTADGFFDGHLLVSKCGPMTKVGQRSIAVGLGNVIKVITVGHERFTIDESPEDTALAMEGRRRRVGIHRRRSTPNE